MYLMHTKFVKVDLLEKNDVNEEQHQGTEDAR